MGGSWCRVFANTAPAAGPRSAEPTRPATASHPTVRGVRTRFRTHDGQSPYKCAEIPAGAPDSSPRRPAHPPMRTLQGGLGKSHTFLTRPHRTAPRASGPRCDAAPMGHGTSRPGCRVVKWTGTTRRAAPPGRGRSAQGGLPARRPPGSILGAARPPVARARSVQAVEARARQGSKSNAGRSHRRARRGELPGAGVRGGGG